MFYEAEHGVGFHPAASGSFLKSVVVMYGRAKYRGSSTRVVTVNHVSVRSTAAASLGVGGGPPPAALSLETNRSKNQRRDTERGEE